MSARNLLDQIQIKTPCSEDWNSMTGNDQVRFCDHCNLTVHNLSLMTPKQALQLVTNSKGGLCVRYQRPDTVPQKLHQVGRRVSRLAAGAITAALSVSSTLSQQPAQRKMSSATDVNISSIGGGNSLATLPTQGVLFGSISGTVLDYYGAVIPGATVTLRSQEFNYAFGTISGPEGQYKFEQLQPGKYQMVIEAPGFTALERIQVDLAENESKQIDHTLQVAASGNLEDLEPRVTMGFVVIVETADTFIRAAQQDDLQTVLSLLTGRNVNLRDQATGATALEHAVRHGNREMVQLLLSAGADVNDRTSGGQSVLMMLGEEGTSDIVWDLIDKGAKVNVKDDDGDTPLIKAAMWRNVGVLNALLQAGAEVEARNVLGHTALIVAAENGQPANVRALVAGGADRNAHDNDGKTPLDYATENNQDRVVKLLRSYGAIAGNGKQKE